MNERTFWDIIIFTDFDIQFNVQLHCGTVGVNNNDILTLFHHFSKTAFILTYPRFIFMINLVHFQ